MNTFRLIISSPDGSLYDGEAVKLSVRGVEGDLAVMAGHVPFITSVKPCECCIELEDGSVKTGSTESGLLAAAKEAVTLLSASFRWQD